MIVRYALSYGGVADEIDIVCTKDDEIPMNDTSEEATDMARILAQRLGREIRVVKITELALVQPNKILFEDASHREPSAEGKVS